MFLKQHLEQLRLTKPSCLLAFLLVCRPFPAPGPPKNSKLSRQSDLGPSEGSYRWATSTDSSSMTNYIEKPSHCTGTTTSVVGFSHHMGHLCKAAALPRVRSGWGQTPSVKIQEGKMLSITNVTACSVCRDGNNALASCLHPEAAASVKKNHQLILLASSPAPKGFLQREVDIKSLDQHQLNHSLGSHLCTCSLTLRLSQQTSAPRLAMLLPF